MPAATTKQSRTDAAVAKLREIISSRHSWSEVRLAEDILVILGEMECPHEWVNIGPSLWACERCDEETSSQERPPQP